MSKYPKTSSLTRLTGNWSELELSMSSSSWTSHVPGTKSTQSVHQTTDKPCADPDEI